jgi:hypothetical protein
MEDPSALFEAFLSYSRTKGGLGRGMRGFFSGMLRGVSNPREGSKILFPLRPRLVLQLPPASTKLVEDTFCEVRQECFKDNPLGDALLLGVLLDQVQPLPSGAVGKEYEGRTSYRSNTQSASRRWHRLV